MALLKFNKSELVNLSYSLRREIILANNTGAYCNSSIVTCNTRRYHGLLAVTLDRFGGDKFLLLSCLDETLTMEGQQFNLGIHCYGGIYEPRGHKYIVDFEADPTPRITYKVGSAIVSKTLVLNPEADQVMIKYALEASPEPVQLELKPFLAFRNVHALTQQNGTADCSATEISGGVSFCMYKDFPALNLQLSDPAQFRSNPCWYNGVTYSDEYRRGFDCREDLMAPGSFFLTLKPGASVVFSASIRLEDKAKLRRSFTDSVRKAGIVSDFHDQLVHCAEQLKTNHNKRKKINAGFTWLQTGLLRETLIALPGLTLYAGGGKAEFEEILDNLIADEQERLFSRTTQVEAPLYMAVILQKYIEFGASPSAVWKKYGETLKKILASYLPGHRAEVTLHPNGLLWAQAYGVALSWMNAYVNGSPVTERAGYQVETNALWYNAVCFALEMEKAHGPRRNNGFVKEWTPICEMTLANYQKTFWNDYYRCLADYVDNAGQHLEIRPNQLYPLWLPYRPVQDEVIQAVIRVVDNELVTRRGIRTLSPRDIRYKGVYEGTQIDRDLAYHQGCAMPFLLEPYAEICFKVKGPSFWKKAEWLTEGFFADLGKHGVGAFSELYDGDPPHEPHGAISSALSTAALLTVMHLMDKYKEDAK